jgi:hypothetical protein
LYFSSYKQEEVKKTAEKEADLRRNVLELTRELAVARGANSSTPPTERDGLVQQGNTARHRGADKTVEPPEPSPAQPPDVPWHATVERRVFVGIHRILHPRTPVPPDHTALRFGGRNAHPSTLAQMKNFTKTVMTPDRKADVFGTLTIAAVYSIAVALIFGLPPDAAVLRA